VVENSLVPHWDTLYNNYTSAKADDGKGIWHSTSQWADHSVAQKFLHLVTPKVDQMVHCWVRHLAVLMAYGSAAREVGHLVGPNVLQMARKLQRRNGNSKAAPRNQTLHIVPPRSLIVAAKRCQQGQVGMRHAVSRLIELRIPLWL
jgi:hypothetical protein